jgi:hypothetical protein
MITRMHSGTWARLPGGNKWRVRIESHNVSVDDLVIVKRKDGSVSVQHVTEVALFGNASTGFSLNRVRQSYTAECDGDNRVDELDAYCALADIEDCGDR